MSPRWSQSTLDEQVAAALNEAEKLPPVVEARGKLDTATAEAEKLSRRHGELNVKAAELWKGLSGHNERLRDALIEDRALTDAELQASGKTKAEHDGVSAALEMLVVELIPAANRRRIQAEADYLRAQEDAILQVATARAQRIVGQLAVVADEHGAVDVDLQKIPVIAELLTRRERLQELARSNEAHLKNSPESERITRYGI